MKPVEVLARDILHGETIVVPRSKFALAGEAHVLDISAIQTILQFTLRTSVSTWVWNRQEKAAMTVFRPGTCDAPACDAHSREVGDDRHYCQSHWRAWELVA